LTILFIAVYFASNAGILLGQHLCMGRISDAALFKQVEQKCGMSMEMHGDMEDCCDDEWVLEIIEDDQQITTVQNAPLTNYHLLYQSSFAELAILLLDFNNDVECKNSDPPDIQQLELYLFYHSLKLPADLQS